VPLPHTAPSQSARSAPLVSLGKPVAIGTEAVIRPTADPHVVRTSFEAPTGIGSRPIIRAQNPEAEPTSPKLAATDIPSTGNPEDPSAGSVKPALPAPLSCEGDGCPDNCLFCCAPCWPRLPRLYVSADYLLWWLSGYHVPPLVTTGPATAAIAGALGQAGTVVLFGDSHLGDEERSGGRFTAGYWIDPCQTIGIEGSFFFLGERSSDFDSGLVTDSVLARPFRVANTGVITLPNGATVPVPILAAEQVAAPGQGRGQIMIAAPTRLWGAEANLRGALAGNCCYRLDGLIGFRYLDLFDNLTIAESVLFTQPTAAIQNNVPIAIPAGTQAVGADGFTTRNQFYGGQIGAIAEVRRGRWVLDLRSKVALGSTHQVVTINGGANIFYPAGTTQSFSTGPLLALGSNVGRYVRDVFTVVPEVGVNLGYQITPNLRARVGYSFLYWSNVVRPGDQIDLNVDVTQLPLAPGQATPVQPNRPPTFQFRSTDFWAQGLNFGLELIW
jgi:hypothetical protein